MNPHPLTILIVDDSESRLAIHSRIIAEGGYRILTAVNGTECLRIAQEESIDIILLDVVLPDINGDEVCRRLKSDPRTYRSLIMLVSSIEVRSLSQSHGLDAGADGYLVLPVSNQELLARVRALERIKQTEDELRRSHQLLQQHSEELERINTVLQKEITEHRRTESALVVSEQYSRSIVNCSLDMIITVDNERRIVEFNESAQRAFGYTREEVVGKHINMLYAEPEDGKKVHSATVENGSTRSEVRNRRKDGSVFTSRIASSVLRNEQHELLGLVGVSRDVTEQKIAEEALMESEERYRLLFTQSPLGILHIDASGAILSSNRTASEIFGIPREQRAPDSIYELLQHPKLIDAVVGSLNGTPGSFQGEYVSPRSARMFTLRFATRPITLRSMGAGSVIAIVEDITEQTNVQRQLIQSQKLESLGLLAGGIAHDFNNLLSMILGNAELLRRNLELDPKLSRYVNGIIDVAHRGGSISKQLLQFSRKSEFMLQPVSLSSIIEELQLMLTHFIPRSVVITVALERENDQILCDKGHIHQVLTNLCINAKDAMNGDGTLTIAQRLVHSSALRETFPEMPEGNYVCLSVADTGPGIDGETLKKIFNPFFTTKEKGKGTGLGLSIVNGIVRSHNGFIDVRSELGHGTTFLLYFPVASPLATAPPPEPQTPATNGRHLLIVDDERQLLQVLKESLEPYGFLISTAGNGAEALALLQDKVGTIDLVITDLEMPVMNGEELYHRLRELDRQLPVMIASGHLDPLFRSRLLKEGVGRIIQKPYTIEEIVQAISHLLTIAHLPSNGLS